MRVDGWKALDASLNVLAERNPDFRVVFRGDFARNSRFALQRVRSDCLPLASLMNLVEFEQVSNVENRLWKSSVL